LEILQRVEVSRETFHGLKLWLIRRRFPQSQANPWKQPSHHSMKQIKD